MLILKIFWSNHFISIRYGQLCYLISSYFILCQLILSYHIVGLISVTSLSFSIYYFTLVLSSKSEIIFSRSPLYFNLFLEGGHKFFIDFLVEGKSFDFIRSVQIFASHIFLFYPFFSFTLLCILKSQFTWIELLPSFNFYWTWLILERKKCSWAWKTSRWAVQGSSCCTCYTGTYRLCIP